MAQLDSFFEYMKKYKGTELCLESNIEPRITIFGENSDHGEAATFLYPHF